MLDTFYSWLKEYVDSGKSAMPQEDQQLLSGYKGDSNARKVD